MLFRSGAALRYFGGKFSDRFNTRELPKEADARKRRADANKSISKTATKPNASEGGHIRFNLSTYKLHALGDYADTIRRRGTTDSYSTQTVSLVCVITVFTAHRTVVE